MAWCAEQPAVAMRLFMFHPQVRFICREVPRRLPTAYNFRLRLNRKTIPMLGTMFWRLLVWLIGMLDL